MTCEPIDFGKKKFEVDNYEIVSYLGSGSYCRAYEIKKLKRTFVGKVFDDSKVMKNEMHLLQILRDVGSTNVPNFQEIGKVKLDSDASSEILIVSPVGTPIRPCNQSVFPTGKQLSKIVKVLQSAHKLGFAHRDVKPGNAYLIFL